MKLKAQVRQIQGRRSCQEIRKQGFYPAVMYGKKTPSSTIQIEQRIWDSFVRTHAVRSKPFELELDSKTYNVLIKDIKRSTATQKIEHLDFYTIEKNKPIVVSVPLRYINQEDSVGLKDGGMLNQQMHEIEISALPKNIPDSVEVDIIALEIGAMLHVSDIVLPAGCTLTEVIDEEYNPVIVSISELREEEVDEVAEEAEESEASTTDESEEESGETSEEA